MSIIQITNLQPTGSDLFQDGESFLTELQATEAHTIYGGKSKKGSKKGSNKKSGGPVIVIVPFPQCPPRHPFHC
jgi:hypothetical protein